METKDYYINCNNEFVIEDYNNKKSFSSFLPSISGLHGQPLWAYYVNRGQCISGFGVNNKDNSIMEFQPANKAYMQTSFQGFRTFLKINNDKNQYFYEPFKAINEDKKNVIKQKIKITSYDFKIEEINYEIGIKVEVCYLTLPNEKISSLIRILKIKNLNNFKLNIELVDGLPSIIPYYLTDKDMKNESNLRQAWMGVEHYKTIPFYKIKALPYDVPETVLVEGGNFYLNFEFKEEIKFSEYIVDKRIIFENMTDLSYPAGFAKSKFKLPNTQVTNGISPCGFGYKKIILKENDDSTVYTMVGHSSNYENLTKFVYNTLNKTYLENKIEENKDIIETLKQKIFTSSSINEFDLYCKQTFLDNILRGGYPVKIGRDKHIFYVYSRKHGDLEREYNFFQLDATPYSQGNSNFRDVNQNRRSDVNFFAYIADANIKTFFNLIQLDGFNPLVLKQTEFKINNENRVNEIIEKFISIEKRESLINYFKESYTPGGLLTFLESNGIHLKRYELEEFLNDVLSLSEKKELADFKEGYWIDHWTYNTDLIEQYIRIYPEDAIHLLFQEKEYTYYDSENFVKPRCKKYRKTSNGIRQYDSVEKNTEKELIIKSRFIDADKVRTNYGRGEIYKCTLISKIITLILNKMASLDPQGVGVEMEANKPDWCDALNGLPLIMGSSLNISTEIKRLSELLLNIIIDNEKLESEIIEVPKEVYEFFTKMNKLLLTSMSTYEYWDKSNLIKEKYRDNTINGISGQQNIIYVKELIDFLNLSIKKIDKGLEKAFNVEDNLYYTYFVNEVDEYKLINREGKSEIKPVSFKQRNIPYFLEGIVHMLRIEKNRNKAIELYKAVKKSGLYDKKLLMYKVNDDISTESDEIGRQKVFPRGWLENESIFLHMEYKYLLELLNVGLNEEFINEFKNILIPFMKPEVYGRSILENSSFIASGVHEDNQVQGQGFVSRLTGASAEFLTIWMYMTSGKKPFYLNEKDKLVLEFKPILPGWLFADKEKMVEIDKNRKIRLPKNTFAYMFMGHTLIVYYNTNRKDTFGEKGAKIKKIILIKQEGKHIIKNNIINELYAREIRQGNVKRIDVYFY